MYVWENLSGRILDSLQSLSIRSFRECFDGSVGKRPHQIASGPPRCIRLHAAQHPCHYWCKKRAWVLVGLMLTCFHDFRFSMRTTFEIWILTPLWASILSPTSSVIDGVACELVKRGKLESAQPSYFGVLQLLPHIISLWLAYAYHCYGILFSLAVIPRSLSTM